MACKLDLNANLAATPRLTTREQREDGARVVCETREDDLVGAVDQIRKNVKKSRALLRLARHGMQAKSYEGKNFTLRDAARNVALVGADAVVDVDARRRLADKLPPNAFTDLLDAQAVGAHALSDLLGDDYEQIRSLGRRGYAEKPNSFVRGISCDLDTAEAADLVPG